MNMFDDLIQIDKEGNVLYNQWIEWDHFMIPNSLDWLRQILRNLYALLGHCLICTALDGCYFVKRVMPQRPVHENCDCNEKLIAYSKVRKRAKAECDIKKFTEYVFKNNKDSKGKNKIFYDLGYTINDSKYLQREFCRQALEQYLLGNYKLKLLDRRGQRIAIPTTLNNETFYSGWMLYPEGEIRNTTPFGGWMK